MPQKRQPTNRRTRTGAPSKSAGKPASKVAPRKFKQPDRTFGTARPGRSAAANFSKAKPKKKQRGASKQPAATPSAAPTVTVGPSIEDAQQRENTTTMLTRRNLLIGAGVVAGAVAVGGVGSVVANSLGSNESEVSSLSVGTGDIVELADLTETAFGDSVRAIGEFKLPYGTLIFANNSSVAACLQPTAQSDPLTTVGLLSLSTGNVVTVLEAGAGADDDYQIYDVRAEDSGMIWLEANILENRWRIYTATLSGQKLGKATLVDEGDSEWECPSIGAVGNYAYWQKLPNADGGKSEEDSLLRCAPFGKNEVRDLYSSTGRMATPLYCTSDSIIITPRADTSSVHYNLTRVSSDSGSVVDQITLPTSMKPLEAGYGENGFFFSFDSIYDYGDGISNLGTYTPMEKRDEYDYDNRPWFHFGRTPSAPPAWSNGLFVVKSTMAVCGIDLKNRTYFAIDTLSGCDDYGDYLASTGAVDSFVTFTQVTAANGTTTEQYCLVRVWAPASSTTSSTSTGSSLDTDDE